MLLRTRDEIAGAAARLLPPLAPASQAVDVAECAAPDRQRRAGENAAERGAEGHRRAAVGRGRHRRRPARAAGPGDRPTEGRRGSTCVASNPAGARVHGAAGAARSPKSIQVRRAIDPWGGPGQPALGAP
jgi:hypothetical protein